MAPSLLSTLEGDFWKRNFHFLGNVRGDAAHVPQKMEVSFLEISEVAELLHQVGLENQLGAIHVEARGERWIAHLPGDRMIWVAMSEK